MHPGRLFQQIGGIFPTIDFVDISGVEIDAIKQIHNQLLHHNHVLLDLRVPVQQLLDLDAVPPQSPLKFLGCFAILESLLAHSPKPTDPYESITRQIKNKLALVNHRCTPSIEYDGLGSKTSETIWTKMYDYRSRLAHGRDVTFDKDLKALVSGDRALKLVRDSVKAVIRQALIEPQLIVDLRDC
jgi:hypothetical protein